MGCLGNKIDTLDDQKKEEGINNEIVKNDTIDKEKKEEEERQKKEVEERIRKEEEERIRREMADKIIEEDEERIKKSVIGKIKREEEEKIRREDEERIKKSVIGKIRREDEERIKKSVEGKIRREVEEKIRREEEENIKGEVEENIRREMAENIREEDEERIKKSVEGKIRREMEEKIREEDEERIKKSVEGKIRKEVEEKIRREEEENIKREVEENIRIEQKERIRREEEERRRKEEEERNRREEEEKRLREEEERRIKEKEEEERRKKEEEERNRREEERIRREEEERIKKEKEEKENKAKNEDEKLKQNEIRVIKEEEERIKRENEEKKRKFEEKIKIFEIEYNQNLKLEEEKQLEKDNNEKRWEKYEKVGGEYRSQKEIREYLLPLLKYENSKVIYKIEPKSKPPYNSGKLSDETINIGLKMFNFARFALGIPNNVVNDSSYEKLAQDAALLQKANNLMAHTGQPRPRNMNDKLYKSGAKGCASCNLFNGPKNLYDAVDGWLRDDGNFTTIGHRRWILHPPMKKTGFGIAGSFYAMYCFDNSFGDIDYKNLPWPCRNMPLEFGMTTHWTLSTGKQLKNDVEVTLTNKKTGTIQKYSKNTKNKFHLSNEHFGLEGCIIFDGPSSCKDGDSFRVDIKGSDVAVSYDVNFFSVKCYHEKELLESYESSCIKKGKNFYYCKICHLKSEEEIELLPHKEKLIHKIPATCTKKGKENYICEFCYKKYEKDLDIIPHNYLYTLLSEETGDTVGICSVCDKSIEFHAPTEYTLWWRNTNSSSSTYSSCPSVNKINSALLLWIKGVNGDKNYQEFVVEVSDNNLVKVPKIIKIDDAFDNILELIGIGDVEIIVYPKMNPNLKRFHNISIVY